MLLALVVRSALGAACAPARLPAEPERVGFARDAAWLWVRAFQVVASPGDGDRCTLHPTCSAYAAQAVRRNGPLLGVWMAAARLLRDHGEPAEELCLAGGRLYVVDRPEDAEWWRSSP